MSVLESERDSFSFPSSVIGPDTLNNVHQLGAPKDAQRSAEDDQEGRGSDILDITSVKRTNGIGDLRR